jgi:dolichyl-phosphate beta-glucosyltransferase
MPSRTVSIVIPAYNEAGRLPTTLEKLRHYADSHSEVRQILVVDDGSRDATATVVSDLATRDRRIQLVSYSPNAGKGYAIRRGIIEVQSELVLISDADLSTPIEEIEKLTTALQEHDLAIGSRGVDETTVKQRQRWYRQKMGKAFNRIMRAITGLPYIDTQCGFKLMPRSVAREIFNRAIVDRFAFDVEMLMLAHHRGFTVAEVPVLWFNSPDSRVHIVRDSFRMLRDVLALRWRLGKTKPPQSA